MSDPGTEARGPGSAPSRRVLLGLGSNLGDRVGHLRGAIAALGDEVVATSDVFETAPVGGPDQGRYLNVVVAMRTAVGARALLARGQALEADASRERTVRWGPRTLDVDILWIDGERHAEPDLAVPHPRMAERAFVMVPLADVAPDLVPAGWSAPGQEVTRLGPLGAVS
ncbi:2-amino-4-hydroxy-6-hydroxymethyldihydropteridine diphosphokinase [Iamia sp.]|uniref:2-amino-4-hydroxy-6- hydroxymethyldihydropteridine diphosphokinase n=1 Tax=Iamia sp. TaxID=2722710 RepID=UPI002B70F218|nr:2-amino-4-hydroxy-6-hydroxymethyldihydropteridine diphosphokinase [Iamia sp.]HXH58533.1 2-amino-4-hydroxy-6-hydroxymethyldihydropteridine diphosphokinase [Iamia sp.]